MKVVAILASITVAMAFALAVVLMNIDFFESSILQTITAISLSIVIAMAIVLVAVLVKIDYVASSILRGLNKKSDKKIEFDLIKVTWEKRKPTINIAKLDVQVKQPGAQFHLKVDSIQLKPSFALIFKRSVGIEKIVVVKPSISAVIDTEFRVEKSDEVEKSQQVAINSDLLKRIQLIQYVVVEGGLMDIEWKSASATYNSAGTFEMQSLTTEDGYQVQGEIATTMLHDSKIQFELELSNEPELSSVPKLSMGLDIDSLDFGWFDILGLPTIQFSNFSYVLNCNIKSQIIGKSVESVDWNISVTELDRIGNATEAPQTVLISDGKWMKSDATKISGEMEASIKINSLEVTSLLKTISTSLPTNIRSLVETQLYGLEIKHLEATYAGDPTEYLNNPDSSELSVDGEIRNIQFVNRNNLPSIENGSVTFRLSGEKFEVQCFGNFNRDTL